MEIRLTSLTPLWTGGVKGQMERITETGIIGSLRWWYEAILRGLGHWVCDPTEDTEYVSRCLFDPNTLQSARRSQGETSAGLHQICPACRVFGCTGWRRQFRLTAHAVDKMNSTHRVVAKSPTGSRYQKGSNTPPRWYFPEGQKGTMTLNILPLSPRFDPILISGVLQLIAQYGGLAAKTQLGYGQIVVNDPCSIDGQAFLETLPPPQALAHACTRVLPALTNMFFAQITPRDIGHEATLNLRFDVRAAFRKHYPKETHLRHCICGTVAKERIGSKIYYSQVLDGCMKVWGWIPHDLPRSSVSREEVMAMLYGTIGEYARINHWREFDSVRDTYSKRLTDSHTFLTSLLAKDSKEYANESL